ncbi:hypothetical protein BDY24DRAFT_372750 [Mrakia frigida]|uniref:uncharacterized protein n=1 Tax=Mrakia frigida TaxID=29902 RepID=UPI003FCBF74E
MSSVASSNVPSPSPADTTSSPLTSLGPSSSGIFTLRHGLVPSSPAYRSSSKIISLPVEIHRLIILSLVELPNRIYLHQSQEDVYLANQELITLSQVSQAYKDLSYPILYEEIVVKSDRALARFFKTIQLYPELKLRVRCFWPVYWYSNSVASPYFVGEFPRLEELSLRNDLRLLTTNYDLNFERYSVEDEEDGIDTATIEAVDEAEDDEDYEGKGKGKVSNRLMTPGGAGGGMGETSDSASTPEVAMKREKAKTIAKQLKQLKKRHPKRLSMSTVVKLKTLEITMNGLHTLPATNIDLDDVETLSIHWVPKPAQDFKRPLPKLKTLYLSTYQIIQDREYEPQLLRLLKLYGPQLRHLHFAFRGIDDHVPSETTVFSALTSTLTSSTSATPPSKSSASARPSSSNHSSPKKRDSSTRPSTGCFRRAGPS